ncbi:MAG TPA: endonuclease domain-containing protein [Terriglobia bacterium]|nr:endonuclease domain-containing protein [Terriglobia bacterium]
MHFQSQDFQGLPSRASQKPNSCRCRALESPENSGLEGKKFRRQHGIGPYIADFYCPECRLIVELDGAVHEGPLETERDETRTTYFKEMGIRVIRFENRTVFESLELVLNSISIALQES